MKQVKSISVPFTDKPYTVFSDGQVYSEFSKRFIKPTNLGAKNKRKKVTLCIDRIRYTVLVNRLVYFMFKYAPKVLKTKNPTFKQLLEMPMVAHRDGDYNNNRLENLILFVSYTELGKWSSIHTPVKTRVIRESSSFPKSDIPAIKERLIAGESYKSIAQGYNCSDMSVVRLVKRLGLNLGRSNGHDRFTQDDIKRIRELKGTVSNKSIAIEFEVSESAISRVLKGKTYRHI